MGNFTITETVTLCVWTCPVQGCGVRYGIDQSYADDLRRNGKGYYCPNGHRLGWGESEADRQRKRAEKAERNAAIFRDGQLQAQQEAQDARNRERAQKAAKTRLKNRIKNGVCPCCKRHFPNVANHIKSKHPEFVAPGDDS